MAATRNGGTSGALPCGTVCSDLWLGEHRPMPNQPPSAQLHNELHRLRIKTGVRPTWSKALGVGSRLSLVAGAAYVGWEIGSGIRSTLAHRSAAACDGHGGQRRRGLLP